MSFTTDVNETRLFVSHSLSHNKIEIAEDNRLAGNSKRFFIAQKTLKLNSSL
jgi:hypothetical protein